jgi:tRNA (uracil-5-)-methyltransferase
MSQPETPDFATLSYEDQLAAKLARFREDFAPLGLPEPAVFRSTPTEYRLRAEFRLWHHDGRLDYAMFDAANPRQPLLLDDFPAAAAPIRTAMPRLRDALIANDTLRRRIFQVEFLATLSGELLISLVYHRKLDEAWEAEARTLATQLGAQIIGRSKGQKVVLERDWLLEALEVDGLRLRYQQIEGSFTQPDDEVNRQMLHWARAQCADAGGDLLELYCGNGNFSFALAPLFGRVLATELSKSSVRAALYNSEANDMRNITLVRMSSEEISDALAGGREYRRLQGIDLASYRFSTLFVDPPRSGLDQATLALAAQFDRVLYISCNPVTLRDNAEALSATHGIAAAAAFDQFPFTHHLECGLLLTRRAA